MLKKILNFLSYLSLLFFIIFFLLLISVNLNIFNLKKNFYSLFPNIELRKNIFNKKSIIENFRNDYNVKFLPFTEFEKLNFKKIIIKFNSDYYINKLKYKDSASYKKYGTFFIDFYQDDLLIADYLGNFYFIDKIYNKISSESDFVIKSIKSDLKIERAFDIFVHEKKIFISYTLNNNNCNTVNISYAEINLKNLNFKNFFNSEECNESGGAGKIYFIKHNKSNGLLFSTAEGTPDSPGINSQNNNSIYGKILFIPLDNPKDFIIYSTGHRVVQGLNVYDNKIIATEHGPRGGDEINKIIQNKNYGWPVVSLGERYDFQYENKSLAYKKNHKLNNFEEPIFSFIPSIGISEIIKLPKSFSTFYESHYVIASLNGRSIYFVRFDEQISKILSLEKIFIGQRVRDLKYYEKSRSLFLALEDEGEIGILTKK
jgi:glucose/arabinose dehydrogenase